jgi:hypothetical protein
MQNFICKLLARHRRRNWAGQDPWMQALMRKFVGAESALLLGQFGDPKAEEDWLHMTDEATGEVTVIESMSPCIDLRHSRLAASSQNRKADYIYPLCARQPLRQRHWPQYMGRPTVSRENPTSNKHERAVSVAMKRCLTTQTLDGNIRFEAHRGRSGDLPTSPATSIRESSVASGQISLIRRPMSACIRSRDLSSMTVPVRTTRSSNHLSNNE